MNKQQAQGWLNEISGKIKAKWGEVTDDEVRSLEGNGQALYGALQRKFGIAREQAEKKINEWKKECGDCGSNDNKAA